MTTTDSHRNPEPTPPRMNNAPVSGARRPTPGPRQGERPYWNGREEVDLAGQRAADSRRLRGIDAARGFALFGMIAVHTLPMVNDTTGTSTLASDLFAGRSAQLFGLLAGLSMAFLTGGRNQHSGRRLTRSRVSLAARALILLLFGLLLNFLPIPVENILPYYGAFFLLGLLFVGLGVRALFAWSVVFALVGPLVLYLVQSMDVIDPMYGPNVLDAVMYPHTAVMTLLISGSYPALPWMSLILLGLALGRLDLGDRVIQLRLCVWGAVVGFGAMLVSNTIIFSMDRVGDLVAADPEGLDGVAAVFQDGGTVPATTPLWLLADVPHGNTTLSLLAAGGLAVLALGAFLLAYDVIPEILAPVAAAGSMTFTLYTVHLVLLAYIDVWAWPEAWTLAMTIGFAAFAMAWQSSRTRGPLEGVISNLSKATGRAAIRDVAVPDDGADGKKVPQHKAG